jgi:L-asparaginase
MKRVSRIIVVLTLAVVCRYSSAQNKPTIVILARGGTIAGAAASGTQSAYTSDAVTIDAMVKAFLEQKSWLNIKGEQIPNVGSQDISFEIMPKLAKRIK